MQSCQRPHRPRKIRNRTRPRLCKPPDKTNCLFGGFIGRLKRQSDHVSGQRPLRIFLKNNTVHPEVARSFGAFSCQTQLIMRTRLVVLLKIKFLRPEIPDESSETIYTHGQPCVGFQPVCPFYTKSRLIAEILESRSKITEIFDFLRGHFA